MEFIRIGLYKCSIYIYFTFNVILLVCSSRYLTGEDRFLVAIFSAFEGPSVQEAGIKAIQFFDTYLPLAYLISMTSYQGYVCMFKAWHRLDFWKLAEKMALNNFELLILREFFIFVSAAHFSCPLFSLYYKTLFFQWFLTLPPLAYDFSLFIEYSFILSSIFQHLTLSFDHFCYECSSLYLNL